MSQPNSEALRAALLAEVPELPAAARANEFAFGKWFFELAEACRLPPLTLAAEVLVAPAGSTDRTSFHSISSAGMLPVHPGQRALLHIKPSRPAYLYVLWVTPAGQMQPLFPWVAEDPRKIASVENILRPELLLPPHDSWKIEDVPGLETLVALARGKPLDEQTLREIARNAPRKLPAVDFAASVSVDDDMVALAEHVRGPSLRLGVKKEDRLPVLDPVDQVRVRHASIAGNLRDYLEAGVCMSFRNAGVA